MCKDIMFTSLFPIFGCSVSFIHLFPILVQLIHVHASLAAPYASNKGTFPFSFSPVGTSGLHTRIHALPVFIFHTPTSSLYPIRKSSPNNILEIPPPNAFDK